MRVVSSYGSNIPLKVLYSFMHEYFPKSKLFCYFSLQFYVVQDFATRGTSELYSDFFREIF